MIDLEPLARLTVWAIALTAAVVALAIASVFADVQVWWVIPLGAVAYMALRLTLFKD